MRSVKTTLKRLQYAALTLAAMMAANSALAAGTASGVSVENTATVDYAVSGVAQELIESSPTGNSNSGLGNGTATTFLVDNMVDLEVTEIGGGAQTATPGSPTPVLATFRVTNEGNTTQDYEVVATNLTSADPAVFGELDTDVDMTSFQVFVDTNDNDTYDAGVDVDTFIDGLLPDTDIEVFVLATAPLGAQTTDFANVRLTATTYDDGSNASGSPTAQTAGPDTTSVDVVFADGAGLPADVPDGLEFDDDSYTFVTADLSITKTSTVVEDPFNGVSANAKAIPGAFVQYEIAIENTGTVAADNVVINDTLAGEVSRLPGAIGGDDIEIDSSVSGTSVCNFDPPPGDTDGCNLTSVGAGPDFAGGDLEIDLPGGLSIAPSETVTIRFQVQIL